MSENHLLSEYRHVSVYGISFKSLTLKDKNCIRGRIFFQEEYQQPLNVLVYLLNQNISRALRQMELARSSSGMFAQNMVLRD